MKTSVVLLFALLFATSSSWAHKYLQDSSNPVPAGFKIVGHSCANPWNEADGPNYGAAIADANSEANQKCYPLQAQRISEFEVLDDKTVCAEHLFGATATALYTCAQ
jgi:hypothetical protein